MSAPGSGDGRRLDPRDQQRRPIREFGEGEGEGEGKAGDENTGTRGMGDRRRKRGRMRRRRSGREGPPKVCHEGSSHLSSARSSSLLPLAFPVRAGVMLAGYQSSPHVHTEMHDHAVSLMTRIAQRWISISASGAMVVGARGLESCWPIQGQERVRVVVVGVGGYVRSGTGGWRDVWMCGCGEKGKEQKGGGGRAADEGSARDHDRHGCIRRLRVEDSSAPWMMEYE